MEASDHGPALVDLRWVRQIGWFLVSRDQSVVLGDYISHGEKDIQHVAQTGDVLFTSQPSLYLNPALPCGFHQDKTPFSRPITFRGESPLLLI